MDCCLPCAEYHQNHHIVLWRRTDHDSDQRCGYCRRPAEFQTTDDTHTNVTIAAEAICDLCLEIMPDRDPDNVLPMAYDDEDECHFCGHTADHLLYFISDR